MTIRRHARIAQLFMRARLHDERSETDGQRNNITAERYERLCDLFDEIAEVSPADQQARLAAIEAEDAEIAALLQRMLAIEAEGGGVMNGEMKPIVDLAGVLDEPEDEPPSRLLPTAIEPYHVISRLGWGSVGDVFLVRQAKTGRATGRGEGAAAFAK